MKEGKKVTLDKDNKLIGGVGSGIAKYFDVDPTIVRVILLFAGLSSGLLYGAIFYGLTYWLLSENEDKPQNTTSYYVNDSNTYDVEDEPVSYYEEPEKDSLGSTNTYEQEEFELDDIMVSDTEEDTLEELEEEPYEEVVEEIIEDVWEEDNTEVETEDEPLLEEEQEVTVEESEDENTDTEEAEESKKESISLEEEINNNGNEIN